MKLISLSLTNFRQHRSSMLTFTDGLTAIVGPNGAGKSSIIEAISYALYGSRAIRGRLEDLKSWGSTNADKMEVSLLFEHEGKTFRAERTLSDAELYLGGAAQPVARGNTAVVSQITTLLGMNHDEFTATFCTEQKGLEFLSGTRGTAERERFIIRMMGYDKLEKLQINLRSKKRELKIALQAAEGALGDRSEIEQRIVAEEEKERALSTEKERSTSALKSGEQEFTRVENDFKKLSVLEESYRKIQGDLREAQAVLDSKKERSTRLELEEKKLRSSLNAASGEGERLEGELIKIRNQNDKISEDLARADGEARSLESEWRQRLGALSEQCHGRENRLAELKKQLNSYRKLEAGSSCPTCKQNLGASFGIVVNGVKEELDRVTSELETLRLSIKEAQNTPESMLRLQKSKRDLQKEHELCKQAEQKLLAREKELVTLTRVGAEIRTLQAEIAEHDKGLLGIRKRLESVPFSEEEYRSRRAAFDAAGRLVEVARLQNVRIDSEHLNSLLMLERSKRELSQHIERAGKLEQDRKNHLLLEKSDELLTDFRRHLNSTLRPRLAEIAGEFITELTDGRYTGVEIGEDFTPTVSEDGIAKAVISGGEEDLLHLCVRLSLSQMLAERSGMGFSLLILDEVFGSLDENRRNNVINLLEKLGKRFEQIIIVTHVEEIKDTVENLISINYDDASGKVSVVKPTEDPLAFNI